MKIGDKVRFLNDVGGGVISGFQGKDMVLVADEDGFEIPTLLKDVVVIETNDYNIAKKPVKETQPERELPKPTSVKQALNVDAFSAEDDSEEIDLADRELTYKPKARERRGAEEVNLFLAFVPKDDKNLSDTSYEIYLVNDCNYYVRFSLSSREEDISVLLHDDELAPNTKLFLDEVRTDRLSGLENLDFRAFCYKREKAYLAKPVYDVALRIEGRKFFRAGGFSRTPFFSAPALLFDIVKDDRPVRTLIPSAEEIREAIVTPASLRKSVERARVPSAPMRKDEPIVCDLHADSLLDTMVGLSPRDILDYQIKIFHETMEAHLKQRGRILIFIHGKGNGTLRRAILIELSRRYPTCRAADASFREYGYGATRVEIR